MLIIKKNHPNSRRVEPNIPKHKTHFTINLKTPISQYFISRSRGEQKNLKTEKTGKKTEKTES
jgi:hypothetical protein